MEHKKSLTGPFKELGEILYSRWGDASIWFIQVVSDPSPLDIATIGWVFIATVMFWSGVEKIRLHLKIR